MEPLTFYYATCNGIASALFTRRGRRLFLPCEGGRVRVLESNDVVMVSGEIPATMTPFLVHELAGRETEGGVA